MNCDLELEITHGAATGHYIITADSPAGAASGELRLDAEKLLSRRPELASAVLASAVPTRGTLSAQELPVREVGQQLFEAVFAERVYGRYTASVQEAARRGEPLRVVLRLRAPELAGLPWEAMFDTETDEYLCQREPIVRYVETAQPAIPLPVNPPLRVLGLVSAPRDLPALDVDEERRRLTDAIDDLGRRQQVELTWAPGGTWPCLQEVLLDGHWHVLHFIGHGGVDRGGGVLALEDELTGQANLVSSARFARLLHTCRPVPRLVVLNSCQSGEAAAGDLLSSTAAALVHSGISAAVAMQFAVTDPAALAFARGFYQALAHNQPVDEAVRLGRIAIDGTSENTLEWVTPVLFLRTDETRLFAIIRPHEGDAPLPSKRPSPEQVARESTLRGLYMQALAAMRTGRQAEAITLLDSLLALEPDYEDAADRRDAARRSQRSAASYERGRAAEAAGNWASAIIGYTSITEPDYRDASDRLADCTRRQQIANLLEELRMHAHAREWRAIIAVSDELTALGLKSAEVDRAAKNARHQIRADEASRAEPEAPEQHGLAARIGAVTAGRLHRNQPTQGADTERPRHESRSLSRKWRTLYVPHFPMLGSVMIAVPLFILVIFTLLTPSLHTPTPFWVMAVLGLAGIAGAAIDYRKGCGVSAAAVGVNSAWLSGYAVYSLAVGSLASSGNPNVFLLLLRVITGVGFIANVIFLVYIFRPFRERRRHIIDTPLLVYLIFMTGGLAVFSIGSVLINRSVFRVAGVMFSAALLAELTGIVIAFIRIHREQIRFLACARSGSRLILDLRSMRRLRFVCPSPREAIRRSTSTRRLRLRGAGRIPQ
jgi:tetratricopeptide (TPR) repeat protein